MQAPTTIPPLVTGAFLLQFATPRTYTQAMSELHDFENEANIATLDTEVEMIAVNHHLLRKDQVTLLLNAVDPYMDHEDVEYGAEFDIKEEINAQITLVRTMRRSVLNQNGGLKLDATTRDIKEVIAAGTTLTNLLMKSHEAILNADRQRAMEAALKAAVETLDTDTQAIFFGTLEELLEHIE